MRYLTALSFATFSIAVGATAQAAPVNDHIERALPLSSETNINRIEGEIVGATDDPDVLLRAPGSTADPYYYAGYPIVWYKWEVPISGTVNTRLIGIGYAMWLMTIQGTPGDDVFELTSPPTITLVDSASSSYSNNYSVEGGKTYYVGVLLGFSLETQISAPYDFKIVQLFRPDPISDTFANRTPIGGSKFSISGSLSALTAEADEPQHSSTSTAPARKTGWMTYTSPTRRLIKLTADSSISLPLLAAYTGDTLATLTRVGQSSGNGANKSFTSTLNFVAEPGVPYSIAVDADGTRAGPFTLKVETSVAAPTFLSKPISTTVFQGDPAFFSVTASATGTPNYQWQRLPFGTKIWADIPDNTGVFSGSKTATLNLSSTTLAMNQDKFRVVVSDTTTGTVATSAVVSLVVTEFEAIQSEVLGKVDFDQIGFSQGVPLPTNNGAYFATGLPKGLVLDPLTGKITGTITAKPGAYLVTYGSTDGKKRNPQQFTLLINVAPYSAYLTGTFEALPRSDAAPYMPVGKLTLKVTATGSYTGSYFHLSEGKSYGIKGQLALNQEARSVSPAGGLPITISRGKTKPALQLSFTITEPVQSQVDASSTLSVILHEEGGLFIGDTFSGVPLGKFAAATPAPWAGIYTARLTTAQNNGPSVSLPRGSGYATLSITASTGALALRGRLSEGTIVTANLLSSADAEYRLAQRLHVGIGGGLAGSFALAPRDDNPSLYHTSQFATDSLYWVKTPDKVNYPVGFGPLTLTLRVEPWQIPTVSYPNTFSLNILGELKINIASEFANNGLIDNTINSYGLPIDLRMSNTGVISVPTTDNNPTGNSAGLKLSINPKNGLFTGSFTLAEPVIPPAKKAQSRLVKLEGVMFQAANIFTNDIIGEGFFLLSPLVKGLPITSGLIELRAGEPNSPFGGEAEEEAELPTF